jgi:hypothetical protein
MTEERVIRAIFTGNKVTELRNLGTLAGNFKCKWGKRLKKTEPSLKREKELFCR